MKRVGIVIGQLSYGGAERQVAQLAAGLRRGGAFDPLVFCLSRFTEPYGSALSEAGVKWLAAPSQRVSKAGKLWWLVREARSRRCDLLYGILHVGNIYAGLASLFLRMPFVASIRNVETALPTVIKRLSAFVCRRAFAVVGNSDSCIQSLETDMKVRPRQAVVIPNAVALREPAPDARDRIRGEWGISPSALVVGTVANLKPQKRVEFFRDVAVRLADAWPATRERSSVPHFVWLGDGPERSQLDAILAGCSARLKQQLHFPGARTDIADCLAAFDVFILTSAYEGMPNALLEAMVAGLPCVATNVPGTRDVLHADEAIGMLSDADDPAIFAKDLFALLTDEPRRKEMGRRAQQHVEEHHSTSAFVEAHVQVFREALGKGRRKSDDR
jgi:glycosyltransferase involved in cell wall biosynthesis